MKKVIFFIAICFSFLNQLSAQTPASNLYKGTVDGKTPITLYIQTSENQCNADLSYAAMYRYNKSKNWIQIYPTQNKKKENEFVMVEHNFSGVLILQKSGNTFTGLWISPDAKKQLKVEVKETPMTKKEIENYQQTMERVSFDNNDC
ncbi:hypothetical protein BSF41_13350 [Flavobacterium sp. ACN2]|jgi:hypothetical protein|uniref:Uncharacterized protein n=1 Tax=Flavobacterium chungangensis TaxID=2708132 RepID=A0ABV8ZKN2_9FLAO|nr:MULTISPECIES: hypothetical protein [unclassified Flavobacterium]MDY0987194.1 hypothetical protein [Flavobacterium sp. CFBP9031]PBI91730.1 hypothetical protein BSF41_13350 [Flavobacterium sp. ACN2]